jgi:hypothetical protein
MNVTSKAKTFHRSKERHIRKTNQPEVVKFWLEENEGNDTYFSLPFFLGIGTSFGSEQERK